MHRGGRSPYVDNLCVQLGYRRRVEVAATTSAVASIVQFGSNLAQGMPVLVPVANTHSPSIEKHYEVLAVGIMLGYSLFVDRCAMGANGTAVTGPGRHERQPGLG
jgi:hypothetical protein